MMMHAGQVALWSRPTLMHRLRDGLLAAACLVALTVSMPLHAEAAQSDFQAATSFPHAAVEWPGGSGEAEFHVAGDMALLTLRNADGSVAVLRPISETDDALAVLADDRLRFAWPALLTWAGPDLGILRDKSLVRARTAFEAGLLGGMPKGQSEQWSGTVQVGAKLQYARSLRQNGHVQDAAAMLRTEIARLPHGDLGAYERQVLTVRLATIMFDSGDTAGAIGLVEQMIGDPTTGPDQMINLEVNLAQYQVRSGAFEQALVTINKVWAEFSHSDPQDPEFSKLPDSEAHFAWIKACALHGLGKRDDADQLMSLISASSASTAEVPVTSQARINGFKCMHDAGALAKELAIQLRSAPPASDLFVQLQPNSPDYKPDRDVTAAALLVPVLSREVADRVNVLSGTLARAVSEWRDGKPAA
jgi:hypothetical protein